jgi:hypothetical protein
MTKLDLRPLSCLEELNVSYNEITELQIPVCLIRLEADRLILSKYDFK